MKVFLEKLQNLLVFVTYIRSENAPALVLNLRMCASDHTVPLGLIEFYNRLLFLKTSLMDLFIAVVCRPIPSKVNIAPSAENASNINGFNEMIQQTLIRCDKG